MTEPEAPEIAITDEAGQPSFQGFDYQILATVWLALDFILLRGSTEIVVEPPSQEDVAASPDGTKVATNVSSPTFQIQIKLLNHELWSEKEFAALLEEKPKKGNRGPAPRPRALQYLAADPSTHYLLVTNTGVKKELNSYCIKEVGENSRADGLRAPKVDPGIARRIGILASKTEDNLRNEIRLLLQDNCHVPGPDIGDCISSLETAVRKRLAGRKPRVLPRAEIEELIAEHRGEMPDEPKPSYPDNLELIRQRLATDHVVLLTGPPGTGKTTIARLLVEELKLGDPPAKDLTITHNQPERLAEVRASLPGPHSHVYFIEDPWGQGSPDENARHFATELPKLFSKARPGKTFIVVSRLAPFKEATNNRSDYPQWTIDLDEKSYSPATYVEIYERQLGNWQSEARSRAMAVREAALKHLVTPYAISFFCGLLKETAHKQWVSEPEAVKLAKQSNVEVFGELLRERIEDHGRKEIIPAIALWAKLTVNNDYIAPEDALYLRKEMQNGGMSDVPDVKRFFDFLTRSRWLQPRAGGFVSTPSVKEALRSFSRSHPADFEDSMSALFRSWSAQKEFNSILRCIREARWDESLIPHDVAQAFDAYLASLAVAADGRSFQFVVRELADYSTTGYPAAELARALMARKPINGSRFKPMNFPKWERPELSPESVARIAANPECRVCAEKFIADYLSDGIAHSPFGETYPRDELLELLNRFDWPIAAWFTAALADALRYPSESTPYFLECVLDLVPSSADKLVADSVAAVTRMTYIQSPKEKEAARRDSEGEEDAGSHDYDEGDQGHYYASKALAVAIRRKQLQQGHEWILEHEAAAVLLEPWSTLLKPDTDFGERLAFVQLCEKHNRQDLAAKLIFENPTPGFYNWAVRTLLLPESKVDSWTECVLLTFASQDAFLELLQSQPDQKSRSLLAMLGFLALKRIAPSAAEGSADITPNRTFGDFEKLFELMEEPERGTLLASCRKDGLEQARPTTPIDREVLLALTAQWPEASAIDALEALAQHGDLPAQALERFIQSEDDAIRSRAWALCRSRDRLLKEALLDRHCECRIAAIERLSEDPSPEELSALLAMIKDDSAFVRERLAKRVGDRQIRAGIPALVSLLVDSRDYTYYSNPDDERDFKVARVACDSLRALSPLNNDALGDIRSFLAECEASSSDPMVHEMLFRILGAYPSAENIAFCSSYLESTWLDSGWDKLGGFGIVKRCVDAVCMQFTKDPSLAGNFNFSNLTQIAKWEGDERSLVPAALAALGLGSDAASPDLGSVIAANSFTEQRARLLACLASQLRGEMPFNLKKHLSDENSFISFLVWAESSQAGTFGQFAGSHPDFVSWLEELKTGDDFQKLLHWATNHLISSQDPNMEALPFPDLPA